jgi:hypothetical protein
MRKKTIPWEFIERRLPDNVRGPTAIARELGIPERNTVGNWRQRGAPLDYAVGLAKLLRISPAEVLEAAEGDNSVKSGRNTALSTEALELIMWVARLDGLGELARKTFTAHAGLLALSEAAAKLQDRPREHENHEQEAIRLLQATLGQYEGITNEGRHQTP